MKKLILLLLIALSCNKNSSTTSARKTSSQLPTVDSSSPSLPSLDPIAPVEAHKTWTEEFMDLINEHRTGMGLRSLIHNSDIGDIAQKHSQDMASGKVAFGHSGFSSRCSEARLVLGGGNWCGENVASGQKTPQAAFNSWMNSTGHRANIESIKATHTGFGYAKNSSGKYYWTQIFIQN